jgi:hypothetical protein
LSSATHDFACCDSNPAPSPTPHVQALRLRLKRQWHQSRAASQRPCSDLWRLMLNKLLNSPLNIYWPLRVYVDIAAKTFELTVLFRKHFIKLLDDSNSNLTLKDSQISLHLPALNFLFLLADFVKIPTCLLADYCIFQRHLLVSLSIFKRAPSTLAGSGIFTLLKCAKKRIRSATPAAIQKCTVWFRISAAKKSFYDKNVNSNSFSLTRTRTLRDFEIKMWVKFFFPSSAAILCYKKAIEIHKVLLSCMCIKKRFPNKRK